MSDNSLSEELPRGVLYDKKEKKEPISQKGYVFLCNNQTERECLDRRVFGLPESMRDRALQVRKGDILFLLNYQMNRLHGVFEAASDGGIDVAPYAFGGRYPAQVRVKRKMDCRWVDKGTLLPLIKKRLIRMSRRGVLVFPDRLGPRLIDELYRVFLEIPLEFRRTKDALGFKAKDGHLTNSYGERLVDDWLCAHLPYRHLYSFPRELGGQVTRCDWYVPDLGLHIEYWEEPRPIYTDTVHLKQKLYADHSLKVVNLYEEDLPSLNRVIPKRIAALVPRCRFRKLTKRIRTCTAKRSIV